MATYYLNAIRPVPAEDPRIRYVAEVFRIEVDQPLAWVKQHADELAGQAMKMRPYTALGVSLAPGCGVIS